MSGRPSAAGIACGLAAYGIWGFFPLYFHQLAAVPPLDVLTHRALWACLFVALLLTLTGGWPKVRSVLATVGMLMYINPTLQFLTAVVLFDEPLQPARLLSFGMIWLGLAFFSVGLWQKTRRPRS